MDERVAAVGAAIDIIGTVSEEERARPVGPIQLAASKLYAEGARQCVERRIKMLDEGQRVFTHRGEDMTDLARLFDQESLELNRAFAAALNKPGLTVGELLDWVAMLANRLQGVLQRVHGEIH